MIIIEKTASGLRITADKKMSPGQRFTYSLKTIVSHLLDLWGYRELLHNLVVRDLKVRDRNSILGILWSLFNPLLMMIVFTLVFTVMTPYSDVKFYPVFVLSGILPWNFFSASLTGAIRSIVDNSTLVNKVFFPREILPVSIVLANLVNFLLALVVLLVMLLLFGIPVTWWILLLPVVIVVQLIFTTGVALILATANVFYRDTQVIMDVVMMAWFFVTPVFYSGEILPRNYQIVEGVYIDVFRWVNIFNPMASIIAMYRGILYGNGNGGVSPEVYFFVRTLLTSMLVLTVGALIFHRFSARFGEEV
jgi:ABC-type polysaccharide/polyol phosphate export permease